MLTQTAGIQKHTQLNFSNDKTKKRLKWQFIPAELTAIQEVDRLLFEGFDPAQQNLLLQNLAHLLSIQLVEREEIRRQIYEKDYEQAIELFHNAILD